ncbi:MAG: MFS transporter, partial [Rhodospirillales bacterium]|nr:MFS transporter [Rhodospirillales bacterium]
GAFGVNGLVAIMELRTARHAEHLAATQTADNELTREFLEKAQHLLAESGVPEALHRTGAIDYLGKVIHAQATSFGFQDGFMVIALVFVAALVPAWLLRRPRRTLVPAAA